MPSPAPTRTHYHHGALREALGAAGLSLLDEAGVEAVGLREVARRCGVSHAAPLRHVPDRRALLTLIAAACVRHMHAHIAAHPAPDGCAVLREAGVAYVDYAARWPERFRLMWRADLIDGADPDYRAAMAGLWGEVMRGLGAMAGGTLPPDAERRLHLAMAVVHGLSTLTVEGGFTALGTRFAATPEATRAVLDLLGASLDPRRG
jgi:AcrR family transcriptional regulator